MQTVKRVLDLASEIGGGAKKDEELNPQTQVNGLRWLH